MDNRINEQKITIQIICILLSIGLWFYVANIENPIITEDISKVPVRLINEDILEEANFVLSENQKYYVNLKVEGTVQDIRKIKREDFEIIIDLSEYAFKVGANKIPVHIVDAPSRVAIKNNGSLTLTINIEELIEKEFDISSQINIIAKPSYYVAPIEFNVNTVKVKGAKSLVDLVNEVIVTGEEYNISETMTKEYELHAIDENGDKVEGIQLSETIVIATIKVNEGKVVPIKVNTVGELRGGIRLIDIIPSYGEVQLSGAKEKLDNISLIETEAINLNSITDNTKIDINLVIPQDVQVNLGQLKSITIDVNVQKEESKELAVEVIFNGIVDGLKVTAITNTIKVKITGYLEDIKDIAAEAIDATIDLSKHTEEGEFLEKPIVIFKTPNDKIKLEVIEDVKFTLEKVSEPIEP